MISSYKRLGDYIKLVDRRNRELNDLKLVGLTINKVFIPSVANIIGTDMANYKIIEKNQFACSTMQVRRDKKMPVALYKEDFPALISQAYPIFEITKPQELLPDYLMMWFSRAEFDREACFHAVGGVRGSLEWNDFLDFKLPIPSPEKQQQLVNEYQTLEKRIALNQQLISKLEETAQAVYQQWFVDFGNNESTFLKDYIETNPKLELNKGKLATYIEMANLSETSMCINGKIEREFQGGSKFQNQDTLLARITPCLENGKTAFVNILKEYEVAAGSTEFIVMRAKKNISPFWVYCLAKDEKFRNFAISSMIGSSGRQRVHEKYLEQYKLPKINSKRMIEFHKTSYQIFEAVKLKSAENQMLHNLKELVLGKMVKN